VEISWLLSGDFSRLVEAYARHERNNANNAWLAGWLELADDAFYLIGSAVFQYME
jgi:hypothetical protein